jgi:hypothetical protein
MMYEKELVICTRDGSIGSSASTADKFSTNNFK